MYLYLTLVYEGALLLMLNLSQLCDTTVGSLTNIGQNDSPLHSDAREISQVYTGHLL